MADGTLGTVLGEGTGGFEWKLRWNLANSEKDLDEMGGTFGRTFPLRRLAEVASVSVGLRWNLDLRKSPVGSWKELLGFLLALGGIFA